MRRVSLPDLRRTGAWVVLALTLCGQAAARPPAGDEAAIRSLRAAYNAAIADHRADRFTQFVAADMVEMTSHGEVIRGAGPLADSYAQGEFRDPDFIAYDRHTDTVQVSADRRFAAERGHWEARRRAPGGGATISASGLYQAGWVRQADGWRIRTESYVRLTCAEPAKCE